MMMRLDLIGYALIVIAFSCAYQLIRLAIEYHAIGGWTRVDAVVVDSEAVRLGRSTSTGKMPVFQMTATKVQYKYWVQGTAYHGFGLSVPKESSIYPRSFTILYDPEDPTKSVIDSGPPWGVAAVWVLGLVAALGVLYAWQRLRSRYDRPNKALQLTRKPRS